MDLIDMFLAEKCCIDLEHSSEKAIENLSDEIKTMYPEAGEGRIESIDWYYPTLKAYYAKQRLNIIQRKICFYNIQFQTFDGYRDSTGCPIKTIYTADQIITELNTIKVSNDSEIMNMFS